jgi:HEPN domain-containing protein
VKWREQAIALIAKADEDAYIARSHQDDPRVSDEMWGFHAQQAVEKLIKAMLSHAQVRYPFTHRLRELAELAQNSGVAVSVRFETLLDLTPYAAELRYSILPRQESDAPLDRAGVLSLIEELREHVRGVVT